MRRAIQRFEVGAVGQEDRAFADHFVVQEVSFAPPEHEVEIVIAKSPQYDNEEGRKTVAAMVATAELTRAGFVAGDISTVMSPSCARTPYCQRCCARRSTCCGMEVSAPMSRRRPRLMHRSETERTTRFESTHSIYDVESSARVETSD